MAYDGKISCLVGNTANIQQQHHQQPAKITVAVRKRPLRHEEKQRNEEDIVFVCDDKRTITLHEPRARVDTSRYVEEHEFKYDMAFDAHASNEEVYNTCVKPLVAATFQDNANCSCFAYGQTGSGKTFTMLGPHASAEIKNAGIFELAAVDIFRYLGENYSNRSASISFFEIYCGRLYDLLHRRKIVAALENGNKEVVVRDLKSETVSTKEELINKMMEGVELRKIGANSVNDESSRSHAVLQIDIHEHRKPCGRLAFIDLAGSERGADTLMHSKQTQQDGAGINRSLLALKECIRAMDQEKGHIPFRDSELTKVLRDIFVGRSRSLMIANVSPSTSCCEQTLNTLRYAARVKKFKPSTSTFSAHPTKQQSNQQQTTTTTIVSSALSSPRPSANRLPTFPLSSPAAPTTAMHLSPANNIIGTTTAAACCPTTTTTQSPRHTPIPPTTTTTNANNHCRLRLSSRRKTLEKHEKKMDKTKDNTTSRNS
eukprot:GHVS01058564.1.p1 GENE.GHVS01058564.1~~GHVS01058564.1.p1  ORF type:complete len:486 (+),score=97.33 GHVS01058564.1:100-1557(+)